jgi:predicted metal-dependent phosphoesterase TrpH
LKIDFHIHTKYSKDGFIEPKALAKKAGQCGITFAVTDHNTILAHSDFKKLNIKFIPGEEIKSDAGDVIGLYINELIPRKIPFYEAIDKIHEQGGLVYLPHMFDITRNGVGARNDIDKIDIIEVFNARCIKHGFNNKAKEFAEKNNLPKAAGSDSHFLWEFGSTYTQVANFDLENPKALLKALCNAKTHGTAAPIYVHGATELLMLYKKLFGWIN